MKVRVSIVGATGYSGGEIISLLARHSGVEFSGVFSGKSGKTVPFNTLHPSLRGRSGPTTEPYTPEKVIKGKPDCVFTATPAEFSAEAAPALLKAGIRVIDISGAFRIPDIAVFEKWYGFKHPCPELAREAVFGITELCGPELKKAKLVANPGCYPTSVILALKPIMGLIDLDRGIICDSASGVSGAGRQSSEAYSFCELDGNFKAYNIGKHKHEPEMRHALGISAADRFVFVAHLLPVSRGILSTMHAVLKKGVTALEVSEAYNKALGGKRMVVLHGEGKPPELKDVVHTPLTAIGFSMLPGEGIVVVSAIDNLLKGAASQAVQNFNVMFGFDGAEGLA